VLYAGVTPGRFCRTRPEELIWNARPRPQTLNRPCTICTTYQQGMYHIPTRRHFVREAFQVLLRR
jgi:hypothetical protein